MSNKNFFTMRKQILLGLSLGFVTLSSSLFAQQNGTCGTNAYNKEMWAKNPQLEQQHAQLSQESLERFRQNGKTRSSYVLPIVFHVIHNYGTENIDDALIYDLVDKLNIYYSRQNSDTSFVEPAFDTLIGNPDIEARFVTKDPFGNCTNGINHYYMHETSEADIYSKINQWNPSKYLNIWVVNTIGGSTSGGTTLGFSHYPVSVLGGSFFIDGVILIDDIFKPSSGFYSPQTLPHEIGHYLNLAHTWGDTNEPGVSCGDDGVEDTPITRGNFGGCPLNQKVCDPLIVENTQNIMNYADCKHMFTVGQVERMQAAIEDSLANRRNLWQPSNLAFTGTDVLTPPVCIPKADFNPSTRSVCAGSTVTYTDHTWRAGVTTYAWTFPGGTTSNTAVANPIVTYSTPGTYDATLTVTNAAGSDTYTLTNSVTVTGAYGDFTGLHSEDFNDNTSFYWYDVNYENNHAKFQRVNTRGKGNSGCMMLNNFKDISNAVPYSDDFFYYERLGNSLDELISPSFDLRYVTSCQISFDYSFGSKTSDATLITDLLKVYTSNNCGETNSLKYTLESSPAGASQGQIITAGYVGFPEFIPANDNVWNTATFNLTTGAAFNKTRFIFEFLASDNANNLYIDNFRINGTLSVADDALSSVVAISPNPVNAGGDVTIQFDNVQTEMSIHIVDINGAVVATETVQPSAGVQTIAIPMNVAKGCYFLNAIQGTVKSTYKVVVF